MKGGVGAGVEGAFGVEGMGGGEGGGAWVELTVSGAGWSPSPSLCSLYSVLCPAVSFCSLVCLTSCCNWLRPLKKKKKSAVEDGGGDGGGVGIAIGGVDQPPLPEDQPPPLPLDQEDDMRE